MKKNNTFDFILSNYSTKLFINQTCIFVRKKRGKLYMQCTFLNNKRYDPILFLKKSFKIAEQMVPGFMNNG